MNETFNDRIISDDNKKYHVQPLFKNYKKTIHSLIDRRLREVELIYEGNNTGLKKLSSFV
jgi:hypothetical protein